MQSKLTNKMNKLYDEYEFFLEKEQYKKGYRCLEKMLKKNPSDLELLIKIIDLTYSKMNLFPLAIKWLNELICLREDWQDHAILCDCKAKIGKVEDAREHYNDALFIVTHGKRKTTPVRSRKILKDLNGYLMSLENRPVASRIRRKIPGKHRKAILEKKRFDSSETKSDRNETDSTADTSKKTDYSIQVRFSSFNNEIVESFQKLKPTSLDDCRLWIEYNHLTIQRSFDELICLNETGDLEKFWYQVDTVKKVLKQFRGRVLLADEVGMGKTIESGMLVKEYIMRGMVKSVLILTPTALVSQWKEEMSTKFKINFRTTDDPLFKENSQSFWKEDFIIASINTAKSRKHFSNVAGRFFDLVIADEAHHLKNRKTRAWKLVNELQKKFIFLLSATPVQNNLIELYNLITLLKPGQFKTEKDFKKEYVKKGNLRMPLNKEKLHELLRDVMIRNTRSIIDMKLPKRFATTVMVEASKPEQDIYEEINNRAREWYQQGIISKMHVNRLLMQAGSSILSLKATLEKIQKRIETVETSSLISKIENISELNKGRALIDILSKNPDEKKVVFSQYLKTMDYITGLLETNNIPYAVFSSGMNNKTKDEAIRRFKEEIPVLVATEVGGEGRNMQFCNTIINYDLPWNPMRIEQRIGRLYRIGQKRDVFIFNLVLKKTIESHILDILDSKINMFEMVIGEIEPILGFYDEDMDFEDIIIDLWMKSSSPDELQKDFDLMGNELVKAKEAYSKTKILDAEVFGEEFEA